jgi:outer membrane protein TolC
MMRRRSTLLALLAVLLTACASGGKDAAALRDEAADRLAVQLPADTTDQAAVQARVDELLAQPLGREDAVVVALLNSPALQRRYAQLEISAAERIAATRPPNPSFSYGRLSRGGETEIDRGISIDLIGLLAWPFERGAANRAFASERQAALGDALALAREVRIAWTEAVAADMHRAYANNMRELADSARAYAQRLADAGNRPQLGAIRATAFHAESAGELARAGAAASAAREQLTRLLGVADSAQLRLPEQLPALPEKMPEAIAAEQLAIDQRLDVQAAKKQAEATAKSLNLNRVTRMVNVLEVGYQSNTSNVLPTQTGYEVKLELPLFDFSSSGRQAQARYDAALASVRETAVNARSEVRGAWATSAAAWTTAAHYRDEVLPLQQKITDEVLLRFNGMLVGPLEVLEQAQLQADATLRAQQALREFWIAEARLASAQQ